MSSFRRYKNTRWENLDFQSRCPRERDSTSLYLYYFSTTVYEQEVQHTSTVDHNPFSRFTLALLLLLLITYLAKRSAVFAVAVGCRPLPRCSRCGCPAEYYDRCHCSSPNLRTRPQDTSITTHVPAGGLSALIRSQNTLSSRYLVLRRSLSVRNPSLFTLNRVNPT